MSTQLSLFDWVSATENNAVPASAEVVAYAAKQTQLRQQALQQETQRLEQACQRRTDEVRPMGELAHLVLARYDLMIRRREEKERQRREQPRRQIRVLTAPAGSSPAADLAPRRRPTRRSEFAMARCAS